MLEFFFNYAPVLEILVSFTIGFALSYIIVMFNYKRLDLAYILATMKEDMINLHVNMSHILDEVKK